ncbi:hypothetical protein GCM10010432_22280 [Catellatospora methionotrophica]
MVHGMRGRVRLCDTAPVHGPPVGRPDAVNRWPTMGDGHMTAAIMARGSVRLPTTAEEAQTLVERHLHGVPWTGRCVACGEPAPCRSRELAHAAFQRLGKLPRRRPRLPDAATR